jgi:hypothetical protein
MSRRMTMGTLVIGAAALLCFPLAAPAQVDIIIDGSLTDVNSDLQAYNGTWLQVTGNYQLTPAGASPTGGYDDISIGQHHLRQNECYVLTRKVSKLAVTYSNRSSSLSTKASSSGSVMMTWYDSTHMFNPPVFKIFGRNHDVASKAVFSLPVVGPGGSATVMMDLSEFDSINWPERGFGDIGDGFAWVQLNNFFYGATSGDGTTGPRWSDLVITDIRFVHAPEAAPMGLQAPGAAGLATAGTAQAQSAIYWDGDGAGGWMTAKCWSNNATPTNAYDYVVNIAPAINDLLLYRCFAYGPFAGRSLTIAAGGVLEVSGDAVISSPGPLILDGGTVVRTESTGNTTALVADSIVVRSDCDLATWSGVGFRFRGPVSGSGSLRIGIASGFEAYPGVLHLDGFDGGGFDGAVGFNFHNSTAITTLLNGASETYRMGGLHSFVQGAGDIYCNAGGTGRTYTLQLEPTSTSDWNYAGKIRDSKGGSGDKYFAVTVAGDDGGRQSFSFAGSLAYSGLTKVAGGQFYINTTLGYNSYKPAATTNVVVDFDPSVGDAAGGGVTRTSAWLGGNGTIKGTVTVTEGHLTPGGGKLADDSAAGEIATLTINNALTLGDDAIADFQITGDASANTYDKVAGLTSVTFGGVLNVTFLGATPNNPGVYTLFSAGSYAGDFDTVNLPTAPDGLAWRDYGAGHYFDRATGRVELVKRGDINGDGHVDATDLLYLANAFGSVAGDANYDIRCDFNVDGSVDVSDLLTLARNWG